MKTILVPSDFSKCSEEAIKYAILFAEKTDRKLLFFHSTFVLIPTSSSTDEYHHRVNAEKEKALNKLKNFTDNVYASLNLTRNEATTRFLIKYGPSVVHNILEATHEHFIDLIILGTHGASGYKKTFFGSNTSKIIEESYCPVLAIPEKYGFNKIDRIAYAASDLEELKKELKNVIQMAQKLNTSLEVFHIMNEGEAKEYYENKNREDFLNDIRRHYKFQNITLEIIDRSAKPVPESIQAFIKHVKPDMLVMLTHKRNFFEKLFQPSKTAEIAFHPTVPLLALK